MQVSHQQNEARGKGIPDGIRGVLSETQVVGAVSEMRPFQLEARASPTQGEAAVRVAL